jgi:hypothetical protein
MVAMCGPLSRHVLRLLIAVACETASFVLAEDLRSSLLTLAHQRLEDMYSDLSQLDAPQEKDGVTMRLSKDDKKCGDSGVPLTFMEFDVAGVRPVDTFNALADFYNQSKWDSMCTNDMSLGEFKSQRARGGALAFAAKPLSSREMYEWQVVDANTTAEEFWVVFSTLENDALYERKPPMSGAVQAENCLAAYKMTRTAAGVHVLMTQQINSHPWPLKARYVAQMGFSSLVSWVKAFSDQAKKQASLSWNASHLIVPDWMLHNASCKVEADTEKRRELLLQARAEITRTDRGDVRTTVKLKNGEAMKIWRRFEDCGNSDVPTQSVPLWHVEFHIPSVSPEEVFNVLAAKEQEPSWNPQLSRAEALQFDSGARGVHEMLAMPSEFMKMIASPRELWEWQVANHSAEDRSFLLALSSQATASSPNFDSSHARAAQCLAAYEVSPVAEGGVLVHMVSHPNPNLPSFVGKISVLWSSLSEQMLGQFASDLTTAAQNLADQRARKGTLLVDRGVLGLLQQAPPGSNASISIDSVLNAGAKDWRRTFEQLDIPSALNSSSCPPKAFEKCAADVHRLGKLVKANATSQEWTILREQAVDELDLQAQGEALASVQLRVIQELRCAPGPGLPDINNNTADRGMSLEYVIAIAATALLILVAAIVAACCYCKRRRQKRELQIRHSGVSLIAQNTVQVTEQLAHTP